MLKKLLKYDFKSVFKYWWIAAVTSLGLAVVGGFALNVLSDEAEEAANVVPIALEITATSVMPIVILGFAAFVILAAILVYVRYFKNFFSDEGYLTFTLPVKRNHLINSKLILSVFTMFATAFVIFIDVAIMLIIANHETVFTAQFWKEFGTIFVEIYKAVGLYSVVYVLEGIVLFILLMVFSELFFFDCIAIACMIVKKAKVITAIGIYYVANGALSMAFSIFSLFGLGTAIEKLSALPEQTMLPLIAAALFGVIACVAVFISILYILQYWIIDRKLNLS